MSEVITPKMRHAFSKATKSVLSLLAFSISCSLNWPALAEEQSIRQQSQLSDFEPLDLTQTQLSATGQHLKLLLSLVATPSSLKSTILAQQDLSRSVWQELLVERVVSSYSNYPAVAQHDQLLIHLASTLAEPELKALSEKVQTYQKGQNTFVAGGHNLEGLLALLIENDSLKGEALEQAAQQSLKLAQELNNVSAQAKVLNTLGFFERGKKNYPTSETYYKQGLPLAHSLGWISLEASSLYSLAWNAWKQKHWKQTEVYFQQSIQLTFAAGDQRRLMDRRDAQGQMYAEQEKYSESRQSYGEALSLAQNLQKPLNEANYLSALSNLEVKSGETEKAKKLAEKALSLYLQLLKSAEPTLRSDAAVGLGELGDKAAVPALMVALKDKESDVRWNAAWALNQMLDPRAVQPLIEALKDSAVGVRSNAAESLGKLGDVSAVPALMEALKDPVVEVRSNAVTALGKLGDKSTITALIIAIKDSDVYVRRAAAEAFGILGDKSVIRGDTTILPVLLVALKDSDEEVRYRSADALGKLGDKSAVPALINALKDTNEHVRSLAAGSLGKLGDKSAVPALIISLKDKKEGVHWNASWALAQLAKPELKKDFPHLVPALIQTLKDPIADARSNAANALGKLGDKSAVPELIQTLKDPIAGARANAAAALGNLGDKSAVPALMGALKDKEGSVREWAAWALGKLGDKSAIPALIEALSDQEKGVRADVSWALMQIPDPKAVQPLFKALTDSAPIVRGRAALALEKISKDFDLDYSELNIISLTQLLKDQDKDARVAAAEALNDIRHKAAIPALIEALQDPDIDVRISSAWAIGHTCLKSELRIDHPALIPALLQTLKDESVFVRAGAAAALGMCGDRDAIPALLPLLKDESERVRIYAAGALVSLHQESAMPILLEGLKSSEGHPSFTELVRSYVTWILTNYGDRTILPALIAASKDQNAWVRANASMGLADMGFKATLPILIELLNDPDVQIRQRVSHKFDDLGDQSAIPALIKSLNDENPIVRGNIAWSFGVLRDKSVIPALMRALKDQNEKVRGNLVWSLGELNDKSALSTLIEMLKDESELVREATAEALGKIGDKVAVPALIKSLDDKNEDVRRSVAMALGKIGDKSIVPLLAEKLKSQDPIIRQSAIMTVGFLQGRTLLPNLFNLIQDKHSQVRQEVAWALGKMGDKSAIPVLIEALKDQDSDIQMKAAAALSEIGDKSAVPALVAALKAQSWSVRYAAAEALGELDDTSGMPILIEALKNQDHKIRTAAAKVLGILGDISATTALLNVLKDEDNINTLKSVIEALGAIGKEISFPTRGFISVSPEESNLQLQKQVIKELLQKITIRDPKLRASVLNALSDWQIAYDHPELLNMNTSNDILIGLELKQFQINLLLAHKQIQPAFELAQELYQQSLKFNEALFQVYATQIMGQIFIEQKNFQQAVNMYKEAINTIEQKFIKRHYELLPNALSNSRYALGQALLNMKQTAEAEKALTQAMEDLIWESRLFEQENNALRALIGYEYAKVMDLKANEIRKENLEFVAQNGLDRDERVFKESQIALEKVIQAEIDSGNSEEAFRLLEKHKLGLLKQNFDRLAIRFDNPLKQQSLGKLKQLQSEETAKEQEKKQLESKRTPTLAFPSDNNSGNTKPNHQEHQTLEQLQSEIKAIQRQKNQILKELQTQNPVLANLWTVNPLSMKEVQSQLSSDTALLQTMVTENTLYLFLLTADDITLETREISQSKLSEKIQAFVTLLKDPKKDPQILAKELYQWLLAPFESELKAYSRLGVIPSRELNRIPFGALMNSEGRYLIQDKAVFHLSNASLLSALKNSPHQTEKVLALGNADKSLSHSQKEVEQIAKLIPGSKAYVTEEATEALVKSAPTDARHKDMNVLHLATHGIVNLSDPNASYLVLAEVKQQQQREDGRLTLREIYDLNWPYQMVFLSACDTGVGKEMGQEVDSLSNAFMAGGAKSIVSSLWPVDDAATGQLGTSFYQALKEGKSKAEAMQQAQLKVMETHKHPFYWAPFFLTGDWK